MGEELMNLEKKIEELETQLQNLEAKVNLQGQEMLVFRNTLNINDISSILKVKPSTLRRCKRYLLPNCGLKSEIDKNLHLQSEWTLEEFCLWNSKPIKERKQIYYDYMQKGLIKSYWQKEEN